MAITAAQVKELRESTGAGMMECKKALTETNGDMEAAIELMRKKGAAKADKRAGKTAAEGLAVVAASDDNKRVAVVEVNCETDFVAKGDDFIDFADAVAARVLNDSPADVEALGALSLEDGGAAIDEVRKELIAKIGENINVRRFEILNAEGDDHVAVYRHGERIAVAAVVNGGDDSLGKDLAMHIAASKPQFISADEVDPAVVEKERAFLIEQAAESGKPQNIIEKMVEGRVRKFLSEITLVGQPFVKDPDLTVEKLLKQSNASVSRFVRLEVGEGIEKKQENFAEEVMAQVRGD